MTPITFPGVNKVYTAPKGYPRPCRDLPVRQEPGSITSCYEFDRDDWTRLMAGAKLYFTIYQDTQPVVGWEIK